VDTTGAEPVDRAGEPASGSGLGPARPEPPLIGVPSIPVAVGLVRPPAAVPSLPVPDEGVTDGGDTGPVAPVVSLSQEAARRELPARYRMEGFPPGVAEQLEYYVYLLTDPRTGRPFYVGRGRGDRCFRHLRQARAAADVTRPDPGDDTGAGSRSAVLEQIREVESFGWEVGVDILRYGMKGSEASLVAGATREALGLGGPGATARCRSASELATRLARPAKFKRTHPVVLLRLGATGADPSYEAARHSWRIARCWTDLGSPRAPRWAAIVVDDLVAGVYRIERWETSPRGRAGDRFSLVGAPDPELERRYRGRNVAYYLGQGTPAPVTYVWCGPHSVGRAP
jgi:hypothetical protein